MSASGAVSSNAAKAARVRSAAARKASSRARRVGSASSRGSSADRLGLVELAVEIGGQLAVVVIARRHNHASFVSCVRISVARAAARRLITVPIGAPRSSAASR